MTLGGRRSKMMQIKRKNSGIQEASLKFEKTYFEEEFGIVRE